MKQSFINYCSPKLEGQESSQAIARQGKKLNSEIDNCIFPLR